MVPDVRGLNAYVISLARREDRRAAVPALVAALGCRVEVVDAVDGAAVDVPWWWRASPGAWGCRQSHLGVLTRAPREAPVLIVEDDADVPDGFTERLGELLALVPADWEAVMLGGEHRTRRAPRPVAPGVVRCHRTCRTHCYLLRGEGVDIAAGAARESTTHWDGKLAVRLGFRARTYAPAPFLVGVTGSPSDLPDSRPLPISARVGPAGYPDG